MQKLGGEYCFTKVYLADVYNQVKLAPESQKRLALSTHRGILLQTSLLLGYIQHQAIFKGLWISLLVIYVE